MSAAILQRLRELCPAYLQLHGNVHKAVAKLRDSQLDELYTAWATSPQGVKFLAVRSKWAARYRAQLRARAADSGGTFDSYVDDKPGQRRPGDTVDDE